MNVKRTIRSNGRISGVFRVTAPQSTWNARNDSTNVSDLLAPELRGDSSVEFPGKWTLFSDAGEMVASAPHCESCYCRKPIVAPRLLQTQRSSPLKRQHVRRCVANAPIDGDGVGGCLTRKLSQDVDENESRLKSELSKSDLEYTSDRLNYEHFKSTLLDDGETATGTHDDVVGYSSPGESTKVNGDVELKEVSDFRASNYFDCHAYETKPSYHGSHKCVHKFRINERLMPEPVNCDMFGVSRCEICNKPMEKFKCDATSPKTKSVRKTCVQRVHECSLTPPRLNVGTGKERIEVEVPESVRRECLGKIGKEVNAKMRKNVPCNSLALRFQKGVV